MARTRVEIEIEEGDDGMEMSRTAVRIFVLQGKRWHLGLELATRGRPQRGGERDACWEHNIAPVIRETAQLLDSVELIDPITAALNGEAPAVTRPVRTVREAIIDILRESTSALSVNDVALRVPWAKTSSIRSELSRIARDGVASKVGKCRYVIDGPRGES